MKKIFTLSIALLAATAGFAQETITPDEETFATEISHVDSDETDFCVDGKSTVAKPKRTKSTGLYYTQPAGMFRHYTHENKLTKQSYFYVPMFTETFMQNMAKVKDGNLWHLNYVGSKNLDVTEDADTEHNYTIPALNKPNSYYAAPTLVNAELTDSFTLSETNANWLKDSQYFTRISADPTARWMGPMDDHLDGAWKIGSNSSTSYKYLWGSGIYTKNNTVMEAVMQSYDKPAWPFYAEMMYLKVVSTNVDTPLIPEGKKIYADIVNTETNEVIYTLEATNEGFNQWKTTTMSSQPVRYGALIFEAKEKDPFGSYVTVPFTIDFPYTIHVYGLGQEGVNVGFYAYAISEQDNIKNGAFYCIDENGNYDDGHSYSSGRALGVSFFGMFDSAKVFTEGSYYTDETKTETEMRYELNKFQISIEGDKLLSNGTLSAARIYTALNWEEEDGIENYYFVDEDGNDIMDNGWILGYELDLSTWATNYYNKATFTATALPEGVAGRLAKVYVASDKGALSADPIILYQGDYNAAVATAIEGVTTVKAKDNKMFNLMGQQINGAHKGIVIKNGKKIIVK